MYNTSTYDFRCQCGNCMPMPTVLQCVCCKEISKVTDVIEELNDGQLTCITSHPGFDPVCLNAYVLHTAYCQYRQQYGVEVKNSHE